MTEEELEYWVMRLFYEDTLQNSKIQTKEDTKTPG